MSHYRARIAAVAVASAVAIAVATATAIAIAAAVRESSTGTVQRARASCGRDHRCKQESTMWATRFEELDGMSRRSVGARKITSDKDARKDRVRAATGSRGYGHRPGNPLDLMAYLLNQLY